jgi:hypothetical protein
MANKRNIHVVPSQQGGWAVKREGQEAPIAHSQHKQDAVSKGREVAQQESVDLIIHNRDGKIAQHESYGNDPFPPRDREH